jgi:hypothetical protein
MFVAQVFALVPKARAAQTVDNRVGHRVDEIALQTQRVQIQLPPVQTTLKKRIM